MKKLLKWTGIIVGALLTILIIGIIALPLILPLDKIKGLAAEKISETINREVKIESVSFNLFEGIKLKKLSVSNRPGFAKKPFVTADAIVLRYAFWPIFKKQIIIKEISLAKPEILIEKSASGTFNFSDMTKKKTAPQKSSIKHRASKAGEKKESFSLIVDSFSIRKARITYADCGTKQTSEIKNANLKISGITLAALKPIGLKFSAVASYQGKDIPLSIAGKIKADLEKGVYSIPSLTLNIAGEKAVVSANVSNLKRGPDVDFSITSKKLSVDPFLAILATEKAKPKKKAKLKKGELTKKVDKATKKLSAKYRIKAKIDIENLSFRNFKIDKVDLAAELAKKKVFLDIKEIRLYEGALSGIARVDLTASGLAYNIKDLKLVDFNATPFTNAIVATFLTKLPDYKDMLDKVYGKLSIWISLRGRGVEPQDIFANAVGDGHFKLAGGEIKRMKILAKVGKTIKSNSLQENMKFKNLDAEFSLKHRVLTAKNLRLEDKDIKARFNGGVDLGKLVWVPGNRLELKLSPAMTQGLPKEFALFRDKSGWLELTFEITGSLKAPIPKPILDKPIEAAIGKIKLKIEAKKVEIEQKVQTELKKKEEEAKKTLEEEKKRLAEEAKQKAAEEAKKQLKNLIKF